MNRIDNDFDGTKSRDHNNIHIHMDSSMTDFKDRYVKNEMKKHYVLICTLNMYR